MVDILFLVLKFWICIRQIDASGGNTAAGVVLAFVVTAIWTWWYFAEGKIEMLGIQNWTWVVALKPYFEKHTLLAAAGIAGMVGAFTYVIIETLAPARLSLPRYLLFIAFISAMVGIPMRISGLFPHLKTLRPTAVQFYGCLVYLS